MCSLVSCFHHLLPPLSRKFFTKSTGEKNCENWSIFSEDIEKVQ